MKVVSAGIGEVGGRWDREPLLERRGTLLVVMERTS